MLEILGALAAKVSPGAFRKKHTPLSAADARFFAVLDLLSQQRSLLAAHGVASGDIDDAMNASLQQVETELAAQTADAQITLSQGGHVDWTAFWKNLPPLGVNMQGPTGVALNVNGQKIVDLVSAKAHGPVAARAASTRAPSALVRSHILGEE
jgi:hypothetical protein